MIVVGILGLLLGIMVPYYVNQRATAQANGCINNLFKLQAASDQFAVENGKSTGDSINYPTDLKPYIKLTQSGQIPPCPGGGTYAIAQVGGRPVCSLGTLVKPPHILP